MERVKGLVETALRSRSGPVVQRMCLESLSKDQVIEILEERLLQGLDLSEEERQRMVQLLCRARNE